MRQNALFNDDTTHTAQLQTKIVLLAVRWGVGGRENEMGKEFVKVATNYYHHLSSSRSSVEIIESESFFPSCSLATDDSYNLFTQGLKNYEEKLRLFLFISMCIIKKTNGRYFNNFLFNLPKIHCYHFDFYHNLEAQAIIQNLDSLMNLDESKEEEEKLKNMENKKNEKNIRIFFYSLVLT